MSESRQMKYMRMQAERGLVAIRVRVPEAQRGEVHEIAAELRRQAGHAGEVRCARTPVPSQDGVAMVRVWVPVKSRDTFLAAVEKIKRG